MGGLPVPRGHLIQAAWGVERERQDWHDRNALRVNLHRMKSKVAAQGWWLVTTQTVRLQAAGGVANG